MYRVRAVVIESVCRKKRSDGFNREKELAWSKNNSAESLKRGLSHCTNILPPDARCQKTGFNGEDVGGDCSLLTMSVQQLYPSLNLALRNKPVYQIFYRFFSESSAFNPMSDFFVVF